MTQPLTSPLYEINADGFLFQDVVQPRSVSIVPHLPNPGEAKGLLPYYVS